jgi:23S rRNA (uracil1939-C5)-methyltransferase
LSETETETPGGELEVVVERILPGGPGLGHAGGKTVMVPLAAPGDRLLVRIDRIKGNVAFASIQQILEASPQRVEPPCPYFGRCGGCDFQQLNYDAQLSAKVEIVKDCLRRLGGIESAPDLEIFPAPDPWHYRSRAQWQFDSKQQLLGYFESGSRQVCDVANCAILSPELEETLEDLRRQMSAGKLPANVRDFRAAAGAKEVSVSSALTHGQSIREISRTILGETYRFNAERFFQANVDLLPAVLQFVLGNFGGVAAIELYCGVGLFTLPLARRFAHVVGVESDQPAGKFAQKNLAAAGLTNAEIISQDVGTWLNNYKTSQELDFLLLDPPRTGAENKVINGVSTLRPQKICYVSCDPATLARDLKKLLARGYVLDSIAAFDMFPQTHHVETVVHLFLTG